MLDILIEGGQVLDGTGSAPVRADVGISQGRIAEIGNLQGNLTSHTIKAEGKMLCPGFIDMHSHDDFNLPVNPLCAEKTQQGVTTQVTGNCGFSPAPILPEKRDLLTQFIGFLDSGLNLDWTTFAEYMERMPPLGLNVAQLVGHVTVRVAAMGVEDRAPQPAELALMKSLVAEAMEAGAVGFSTGLMYVPSTFADTDEVVSLAEVAARFGGGYHSHIRDMGLEVFEAVQEAVDIGRRSGARVQISHMKINKKKLWGRATELMGLLEQARAQGQEVSCDLYPYTAGSGGLRSSLPKWAQIGGMEAMLARLKEASSRQRISVEIQERMEKGINWINAWDEVLIAYSPNRPEFTGLNLLQIAARENKKPVDSYLDLLIADACKTGSTHFMMNEEDVRTFMKHPLTAIGSDGIFRGVAGRADPGQPHPRHFGTFPRILGHYCREENQLELPEAVRKMTSLSADMLRLIDRGRVKTGAIADLVVFDPAQVRDNATYDDPQQPATGIEQVLNSGIPVVRDAKVTGDTPGRMLKRV